MVNIERLSLSECLTLKNGIYTRLKDGYETKVARREVIGMYEDSLCLLTSFDEDDIIVLSQCENIRIELLQVLQMCENYEKVLSKEDIDTVISVLRRFLSKEYFLNSVGHCECSWYEMVKTLTTCIGNLIVIADLIEMGNIDLDVYEFVFYDYYC